MAVLKILGKTALKTKIPWIPIDAAIKSEIGKRNEELYINVIEQFDVGNNPRYVPRDGKTYCNIFVWDVTRAMNAEIPHWITSSNEPASHNSQDAHRINCNAMYDWLHSFGPKYGWNNVSIVDALNSAARGCPTIAIYRNPNGNGHIVVVRPDWTENSTPLCAQAGNTCFSKGNLVDSFGINKPEFWSHE